MAAPDADALGAGFSSIAIYLLMALVLIVKPQGLVAAPGFQS
jgi:branched-chain amino acid transport system permease protein